MEDSKKLSIKEKISIWKNIVWKLFHSEISEEEQKILIDYYRLEIKNVLSGKIEFNLNEEVSDLYFAMQFNKDSFFNRYKKEYETLDKEQLWKKFDNFAYHRVREKIPQSKQSREAYHKKSLRIDKRKCDEVQDKHGDIDFIQFDKDEEIAIAEIIPKRESYNEKEQEKINKKRKKDRQEKIEICDMEEIPGEKK